MREYLREKESKTSPAVTEGVKVESVAANSPAFLAGISAGDRIMSVSGKPVSDLLDLHFFTGRERFWLRWRTISGQEKEADFRLRGAALGVHPEPVRVRRCRNKCLFCFVHQLPRGLRRSLYVKDEDVRLSFLHGNYVTFSDINEEEIRKILRYRLSPLYVSIHTTDPDLRRTMLGNPAASDVMETMHRLVEGGITLHGQFVVCPGINDGEELERSLLSLLPLRPGLSTVAVVPVGLTSHRQGLPPLRRVRREEARATLRMLSALRRMTDGKSREPFASAADEYYLIAGKRIPGRKAYGGYAQIENGVGLLRRFLDGEKALFRRRRWERTATGGVVITGYAPRAYIIKFIKEFSRRCRTPFEVVPVGNRLMGPSVTVTGLLGGKDILAALKGKTVSRIYLPSVTLRDAGDLFLDNLSPGDLESETKAPVHVFEPTPGGFYNAVYREKPL